MGKIISTIEVCRLLKTNRSMVYRLEERGHIKRLDMQTWSHYYCRATVVADKEKLLEIVAKAKKNKNRTKYRTSDLPALGRKWQSELERGKYPSITALARANDIYPNKVSYIIGLLSLSDERLDAIASGRCVKSETELFKEATKIRAEAKRARAEDIIDAGQAMQVLGVSTGDLYALARAGVIGLPRGPKKSWLFQKSRLMSQREGIRRSLIELREATTITGPIPSHTQPLVDRLEEVSYYLDEVAVMNAKIKELLKEMT